MKKFTVAVLLTMSFQLVANAQITDSITGKWKFQEIYNTNGMDSAGIKMLKQMFGEMTIYLKGNNHYRSEFMTKDQGLYQYEQATQKLTLVSNKGTRSDLELSVLTNETLLLSFGKGKAIVLSRTSPTPEDEKEEAPRLLQLVSISTEQLCKKWFLKNRYLPNRTAEQLNKVMELFKGTYFDFKTDQTFTVRIGQITQTGKWKLSNENRTLDLTIDGETKIWNIKSISGEEIQLIRGNTDEFWTFSTKE